MTRSEQSKRFRELVEEAGSIVLTTHINPDGDAIGSQYALASFLRTTGKFPRIINQDPTPEILRFIEDPAIPVEPYAAEQHDPVLREAGLVILVDNSAPDRLGRMEPVMREVAGRTLCIDHHPTRGAEWRHNIVDVASCATTAIIYELAVELGWRPDLAAAEALYVGLATDTGFFRFESTSAKSHSIAAALVQLGAQPAKVFREIHERNSPAFARLLGHALAGLRTVADGAIASVTITRDLLEQSGAVGEDPAEITTPMLSLDGVRVAALYRELPGGKIKVSLRSKGDLDVHKLATEFGGGGHRNASGIVVEGSIEEIVEIVTDRLTALLEKSRAG
jgi:nanoRNase/pAp phosphatase (c-di-AMP/oligoRNAs hydrolase)